MSAVGLPDPPAGVRIRPAGPGEDDAVVALAGAALGWRPGEPNEELFRWKHEQNPFGRSPVLVAEAAGELVALRTFLRWEFVDPMGRSFRAVRAVDTATRPDWQGRGLFRALTLRAVRSAIDEGCDFVFNTPNDQSRPGYLKMGWVELGRLPVAVSPGRVGGIARLIRARVAAEKWSEPTAAGRPAAEVLEDPGLADLLDRLGPPRALATPRSAEVLRWRYAQGPVHYRAAAPGGSIADGLVLFRLRRRGPALELVVDDVLVPAGPDAERVARDLVAEVRRSSGADHALAVGRGWGARWLSVPSLGPVVTWRALARTSPPALSDLDLVMGDVELL